MNEQEQLDAASDLGAAAYRARCDGHGNCEDIADSDLACFGGAFGLADAFVAGFDAARREGAGR